MQRLVVALAFVLVVRVVGRVVVGRVAHRELVVVGVARALRRPRVRLERLLVVVVLVVVPVAVVLVVVAIADRRLVVVIVVVERRVGVSRVAWVHRLTLAQNASAVARR